jgi:hypothetical protein
MSWKRLPVWIKTGVIFTSVFFFIVILDLVLLCGGGTRMTDPCGFFLVIAALPVFSLTRSFGSGYPCYFATVVAGAIFYFAVGAGIGWLCSLGKSRSRPDEK